MRSCNQAEKSALLHPEVSEEHRGRIADGSIADLLVVRGNPVDDIDMVACQDNHLGVIKGGRAVSGFFDVPKLDRVGFA